MTTFSSAESGLNALSEDERRALRASRFSALHPKKPSQEVPRLAHPGGAMATNKAAALAKFLKRKLESGEGTTLNPKLVELAVKNAKESLHPDARGVRGVKIRHVDMFHDPVISEYGTNERSVARRSKVWLLHQQKKVEEVEEQPDKKNKKNKKFKNLD